MNPIYYIIAIIAFIMIAVAEVIIIKNASKKKINDLENQAKSTLEAARKESESLKKESILEAKEEVHKLRSDCDRELRERRNEVQRLERRLIQREESIDKKSDILERKDTEINEKMDEVEKIKNQVQELYDNQKAELERISNMSCEEAKQLLLDEVNKEIKHDVAVMIKEVETKANESNFQFWKI